MNYIKTLIKSIIQTILFDRIIWKVRTRESESCIFLTFDDGPASENTSKILDILEQHQIKAVFFVTGIQAQKHPEIVRRIHQDGHLLGNHSVNHPFPPDIGQVRYISEILLNQKILTGILNIEAYPKLVRPPYGYLGLLSTIVLIVKGYRIVMWSKDSEDSYVETSEALITTINKIDVENGDILLFHDDYKYTVDALETVITLLENNGINIHPLNKYI